MSKFVIHPVWPVKSLQCMEYGLYRVTRDGEQEVSRSASLDCLTRLLRRLKAHSR